MEGFFVSLGAIFMSVWTLLCSFLPIGSIRITAEPSVYDCGNDYYAVVWATSTKGSGCVKYTYGGEEKTIWEESAGIIKTDDTVHSVLVPKKELQGNKYKVASQYVGYKFGYNAGHGRTVESEEYSFCGIPKDDGIKILSISDIHYMEKEMKQSLEYFADETPDIVVMLGDITSTLETKSQFVNYFLKDAAYLTNGEIPIIYTRGNHETRGEFGAELADYLPMETGEFYYTTSFGSLGAVVIDSGEDKEDSHPEYDGLVNFEGYREKEYEWLSSLEKSEFENCRYKIAFSHHPKLGDFFGKDWTQPLKALEMDLIVGGHYHKSEFTEAEGEIPVFIDCGKNNTNDGTWAASMLTLENGTIRMLTIDNTGNTLLDKTISVE